MFAGYLGRRRIVMRWKKIVSGILMFVMVLSSTVSAAPLSAAEMENSVREGINSQEKGEAEPETEDVNIVLGDSAFTLTSVGETKILTATITPKNAEDKAVVWSSDNEEAATVNPVTGEVTAIANGTAVITAVPFAMAVTSPVTGLTVAASSLSELHTTALSSAFFGVIVAVRIFVSPTDVSVNAESPKTILTSSVSGSASPFSWLFIPSLTEFSISAADKGAAETVELKTITNINIPDTIFFHLITILLLPKYPANIAFVYYIQKSDLFCIYFIIFSVQF